MNKHQFDLAFELFRNDHDEDWRVSEDKRDYIRWSWRIGGMSGGSCWGGTPEHFSSDDDEPNPSPLDTFLEDNFPDILFSTYKKISRLVKCSERTENEYYGNYTDYAVRTIYKTDLYAALMEAKCITN